MTLPAHPSRQRTPTACVAIELDPSPPLSARLQQAITIEWGIARRALKGCAPKGSSSIVHLELRIEPDHTTTWTLIDPTSSTRAPLDPMPEQTPLSITRSADRLTIESPTLCAHIGINTPASPELIYVRTAIFAELDLPGGRYEPIGCSIVRA
jgi:hypothetical protein